MELRILSSTFVLLSFCFSHALAADDPTSAAGALAMCAQVCLTSAFYICNCGMLDFKCGCTCSTFTPNAKSCIQNSCSLEFQKAALDMIATACSSATSASTTTTSPISTSSTSTRTLSPISGTLSTTTSNVIGEIGVKSTTISSGGIGGTTPTPSAWGPYGGNGTGYANVTQCWIVTDSGMPRSTCAVQANPFGSIGTDIKPRTMALLLLWSVGVLFFHAR